MSDTILIVDDSSFIVDGLAAILKKKYRTLAAYSGEDCLAILGRETPSIIILDVMMEPIDGWETLARIREHAATRWTPVLMFSARKLSPDEAEKHLVRLDDFIQKPVSPKKIIESIEKVLDRRKASRVVTDSWKAAGAGHETIEEYLTLTTSLEVDLSLCQNMRLQYDLTTPLDGSQAELRSIMAAIEARIGQERRRIATLEQEMNALAGSSRGTRREAEEERGERETGSPRESPAGIPEVAVSSGTIAAEEVTGVLNVPAGNTNGSVRPAELPGSEPSLAEKTVTPAPLAPLAVAPRHSPAEPSAGKPAPNLSEEDELFEDDPVAGPPGDEPFDAPEGEPHQGPTESREKNGAGSSVLPEEQLNQPAFAGKSPIRPGSGPDRTVVNVQVTEKSPAIPERKRETSGHKSEFAGSVPPATGRLRGFSDAPPSRNNPAEHRHLVPAELDIPPVVSDEPPTGAGADVPTHQEQRRGRKRPADQRPAIPVGHVPREPVPGSTAGGIIDRIIALFFRRKKP